MCGVAALWGHGDIWRMTESLKHRGPDGEGFFKEGDISLGIKRLAVIDIINGRQPIFNEDGSVVVVFNGEIFNYKEIKTDLISKGHIFSTETDTEVLVHAYEEYGTECLNIFNGMFAFILLDKKKKIFFTARDRMGEKPLYYYKDNERLVIASEIKAIRKEVSAEIEIDDTFFSLESSFPSETIYKGIKSLEPGHFMIYNGSDLKIEKYWDFPEYNPGNQKESYYVEKLRFLLEDSVRIRLRSDVPVGVFLSGGIDSSIIASIANPEKVFSCRYPYGAKYDEIHYAKSVAQNIGAEHIIITPTSEDFATYFKSIISSLDEPVATASPFSAYMLAKKIASTEVKVILSGEGADEIFGGYTRYMLMALSRNEFFNSPYIKNYRELATYFYDNKSNDDLENYFLLTNRNLENGKRLKKYLSDIFSQNRPLIDLLGISDFKLLFPSLINMVDRCTSAFGLESRCPFLDYRILEFGFNLPPELKIKEFTTKYILREAVRGIVPDEVLNRKDKKGLVSPVNIWFENDLKNFVDKNLANLKKSSLNISDKVEISNNRGEFDRTLYSLLSFSQMI